MEFDLDKDLVGDRPGTSALEPSNTAPVVASSPRSPRVSRRRRGILSSEQAGPFTGAHGKVYDRVVPPSWNLSPDQYRQVARHELNALNGVRGEVVGLSSLVVGGPAAILTAVTEPGAIAHLPVPALAVLGLGGIVATLAGLIWGLDEPVVRTARENARHDWSVLRDLDPAQAVKTRRLPYEVSSLLSIIADGDEAHADPPPALTRERHDRLSVVYRLATAMIAAVEADSSLPPDDRQYRRVDFEDLYRLCPNELRELTETGITMGGRFASVAGSLHGQMAAIDRARGGATARPSNPTLSNTGGTIEERWGAALTTHDEVVEAWTTIVTDPLAALEHSLLLDVTQPRTAAFIEAYGHAQDLRAVHGTALPVDAAMQVAYFAAVRKAHEAWIEAVRHAKHVHLSWLPDKEAALVRKATALLASAGDDAQPLHLRAEAAAKASHLLGKVTSFLLPPMAMHALEASRRLVLAAPTES